MKKGQYVERGFLNMNQGNKSYMQNVEAQLTKFEPPKHEIELEKFLSTIKPRDGVKKASIQTYIRNKIEVIKQAPNTPEKNADLNALKMWQNQMDMTDVENGQDLAFVKDFTAWLLGKETSNKEDYQKTPWGKKRVKDSECLSYLNTFLDAKFDFRKKLALLVYKGISSGLNGVNEHYLFFKYIIRGGWEDINTADFLHDWNKYLCESGPEPDIVEQKNKYWTDKELLGGGLSPQGLKNLKKILNFVCEKDGRNIEQRIENRARQIPVPLEQIEVINLREPSDDVVQQQQPEIVQVIQQDPAGASNEAPVEQIARVHTDAQHSTESIREPIELVDDDTHYTSYHEGFNNRIIDPNINIENFTPEVDKQYKELISAESYEEFKRLWDKGFDDIQDASYNLNNSRLQIKELEQSISTNITNIPEFGNLKPQFDALFNTIEVYHTAQLNRAYEFIKLDSLKTNIAHLAFSNLYKGAHQQNKDLNNKLNTHERQFNEGMIKMQHFINQVLSMSALSDYTKNNKKILNRSKDKIDITIKTLNNHLISLGKLEIQKESNIANTINNLQNENNNLGNIIREQVEHTEQVVNNMKNTILEKDTKNEEMRNYLRQLENNQAELNEVVARQREALINESKRYGEEKQKHTATLFSAMGNISEKEATLEHMTQANKQLEEERQRLIREREEIQAKAMSYYQQINEIAQTEVGKREAELQKKQEHINKLEAQIGLKEQHLREALHHGLSESAQAERIREANKQLEEERQRLIREREEILNIEVGKREAELQKRQEEIHKLQAKVGLKEQHLREALEYGFAEKAQLEQKLNNLHAEYQKTITQESNEKIKALHQLHSQALELRNLGAHIKDQDQYVQYIKQLEDRMQHIQRDLQRSQRNAKVANEAMAHMMMISDKMMNLSDKEKEGLSSGPYGQIKMHKIEELFNEVPEEMRKNITILATHMYSNSMGYAETYQAMAAEEEKLNDLFSTVEGRFKGLQNNPHYNDARKGIIKAFATTRDKIIKDLSNYTLQVITLQHSPQHLKRLHEEMGGYLDSSGVDRYNILNNAIYQELKKIESKISAPVGNTLVQLIQELFDINLAAPLVHPEPSYNVRKE